MKCFCLFGHNAEVVLLLFEFEDALFNGKIWIS